MPAVQVAMLLVDRPGESSRRIVPADRPGGSSLQLPKGFSGQRARTIAKTRADGALRALRGPDFQNMAGSRLRGRGMGGIEQVPF
jgi:hypothetical protein